MISSPLTKMIQKLFVSVNTSTTMPDSLGDELGQGEELEKFKTEFSIV